MNLRKRVDIVAFSVLGIAIFSLFGHLNSLGRASLENLNILTLWWIINSITLYAFWRTKKFFFDIKNADDFKVILWYLSWISICIFRGIFVAETYWDFKALISNSFALLIPIVVYGGASKVILQAILSFYLRYMLILFFFIFILSNNDAYGYYLVPVSFLILFLPSFSFRWKFILIAIDLFVVFFDMSARSNVIKFGVPILLLLIFYFKKVISVNFLELIRKMFFILPFILFALAVNGIFNPFKMDKYIERDLVEIKVNGEGKQISEDLKADTRTFLYVEVLSTAKKYNSWVFGRSPARGNISKSFADFDMNGRGERIGNEVNILNVFTWTGVIGVILLFFVYYKASYLALNKSNNWYSKVAGVFLSFRWIYGWVEDFTNYSLNTFFLWILIGICLSRSFREMSDKEVKAWVRGIYDKKYLLKKELF